MKAIKLLGILLLTLVGLSSHAQSDTTSIRLYGNEACKLQLEEIAKTFDGVISANYNATIGRMNVTINQTFNRDLFIFLFASKGYDAENVRAKDAIYSTLPDSYKYTRKPDEVVRD